MSELFLKPFYERFLGKILIFSLVFYLVVSVFQKATKYFFILDTIQPFISFIKLMFFVFFTGILVLNYKSVKTLLNYLIILFLIFLIANFYFFSDASFEFYESISNGNIFCFIKYLYPFIFIGVFSLIKNNKEIIHIFFSIIESVLVANAFFIFIGFIFSIDYFQSYPHSFRFGYSGILDRVFLVNFSITIISRWIFIKKMDWRFYVMSLGALLTGTKLILLFFTILAIYYLYEKGKTKWLFFLSSILLIGLVFYREIIIFMTKLFPFWQPLLIKQEYITIIFSRRNLNFSRIIEYLEVEGTNKNLLIGGIEFPKYLVEMDFVDLFLFFGLIGGVIYIILLSKIINKFYHIIPLLSTFFVGGFFIGTITMSTYLLWCYESNLEKNKLFCKIQ